MSEQNECNVTLSAFWWSKLLEVLLFAGKFSNAHEADVADTLYGLIGTQLNSGASVAIRHGPEPGDNITVPNETHSK